MKKSARNNEQTDPSDHANNCIPAKTCTDHKLSPFEIAFCAAYLKNGMKGVPAYLSIRPATSYQGANTLACRLLQKVSVRAYIDSQFDNSAGETLASRANLTKLAKDIHQKAIDSNKLQVGLNAIHEIGSLHRLYDKDAPDPAGYNKLLQALQVNVQINQGDSSVKVVTGVSDKEPE